MTVSSGNFAELLWPGIKAIYGDNYNDYQPIYTQIFDVMSSDKAFEKVQGITGLPLAGIKDQGASVPYVDFFQGFQQEFVHTTYALGAIVTREMYEDDQYDKINKLPKMLARSMRQTEETQAHNVLNNGFTVSNGPDGQPLFSTAHPNVVQGTQRNRPQTDSDLTQASLEQAYIDISNFVDDQQLKILVKPKALVVPNALQYQAMRILQSQYTTGSADNDINPIFNSVKLVYSPYLTDTDAWFLTTDTENGLTFFRRRASEIDRDNDFDSQNLKFLTTQRFSTGFTDWKAAYGSPGAG